MVDGPRRTERPTPTPAASPLLTEFQIKLLEALAAKQRWAAADLDREKAAATPQGALDLLNPVTAGLTITGHYENVQVVHEAQLADLEHRRLGAATAATLMRRHGLDLEALASMDQAQLRRWISPEAAVAVRDLFSDPDVKLARRGVLDTQRYACLDPAKGADKEHLKSVNALLGAEIKARVDVAEGYYRQLATNDDPVAKGIGQAVQGTWQGAVKLRRAAGEAVDVAGRHYAGGTDQGARLGQAAVAIGGLTLEVVGAPILAIDPAADDATRGGAAVDTALLFLGVAGNAGRSFGVAGAGGPGRALLSRAAKWGEGLQGVLRPIAELDRALRSSNFGRTVDELGEALNPKIFERRPPLAPKGEAGLRRVDPEATLPDLEVAPEASIRRPVEEAGPQLREIDWGMDLSDPALTRPILEEDLVDLGEQLRVMAERDARAQVMRAMPTEIVPRAERAAAGGAEAAEGLRAPGFAQEATAVGDLSRPSGAFAEPTWPEGALPSRFQEPTATGRFWDPPPPPAARTPGPKADKVAPPNPAKVKEAGPPIREVQDNLQAPPQGEVPPAPLEPKVPSEAPTDAPTFRIGHRRRWILAAWGSTSGPSGTA